MHRIYGKIFLSIAALCLTSALVYAQSAIPQVSWPQPSYIPTDHWPQPSEISNVSNLQWPKTVTHPKIKKRAKAKQPTLPNHKSFKLPKTIIGIKSTGKMHYHITAGRGENFMEIKGNPKAVAALHYQIKDGILHLYYVVKNKNFFEKLFHPEKYNLDVYLNVRKLHELSQGGISSMNVRYKNSQPLKVQKWGPGYLNIKGRAIRLSSLENNGSGQVTIDRVYSTNLFVTDNGSGNVTLVDSRVNLRELTAHNSGLLTINNIRSNHLILNIDTDGLIKLTGEATVATINFDGSGNLRLYWVKSKDLTINTDGRGTLALAGVSNVVNAYADGRSHLDLRYLRADSVFITTYHLASADVWANNDLYALAENNSNIYYYSHPKYMSRMMRQSGSVLPMSEIQGAILSFNTKGSIK